jgi:CelD/BcsL family acetyltransferase involved in cellulose biosynthesis
VLTVTRVSNPDELATVAEEWADLHRRSESTNPFLGPEWSIHWVRDLMPEADEAWVLLVRDAGRLVGVAPMHLHHHRSGIRRLQMIGTGPPRVNFFETPSVLAEPDFGRQVARAVVEHLASQRASWHITTITLGETNDWLEPGWLPDADFTVLCFKTTPYVVLPLPMEARGPRESRRNLREAVRRSRNRMNKRFGPDGWRVERIVEPEAVAAAGQDLARLHRARAANTQRGKSHTDSIADSQICDYLLKVTTDLAERKQVLIYCLVADGRTLAAQMVLHTDTATFLSLSGFTDDAWDYSPTNYLQWIAVTEAAERGHHEVNLSAAPTEAKLRWSRSVRHSPEYLVVGTTRFARLVAGPLFLLATTLNAYRRELPPGGQRLSLGRRLGLAAVRQ